MALQCREVSRHSHSNEDGRQQAAHCWLFSTDGNKLSGLMVHVLCAPPKKKASRAFHTWRIAVTEQINSRARGAPVHSVGQLVGGGRSASRWSECQTNGAAKERTNHPPRIRVTCVPSVRSTHKRGKQNARPASASGVDPPTHSPIDPLGLRNSGLQTA